jgi:hypothetical protein
MLLRAQDGVDHEAFDFDRAYTTIAKQVSESSFEFIVRFKVFMFTSSAMKVAHISAEYLKLPALELRTDDDIHSALTNMGVVPAVFCVFMLCALITARVGPFARMTKLEVTNRVQGYAIWWIMKNFLIAA